MTRIRTFLVALVALALIAGPLGVPAQAGASPGASASASAKAKKKCKKFKGAKKRKCLKNAGKSGKKPWAGSPYRPGMTCAITAKMQKVYAKYGLFCLDISTPDFYLTTLTPLK